MQIIGMFIGAWIAIGLIALPFQLLSAIIRWRDNQGVK